MSLMVYPSNSLFNPNRDIYQHVINKDAFIIYKIMHIISLL
ncbi:hypothetical protein F383_07819 [Gossypium arboreum]|uniref:Uncharacterized protein n=1 Tax=Gossypium arboreum TaxID=29729 RepID=A0A0B0PLA3_GOSAR|nr:hypothetical protein F383_07819 [Gossypium arboreum]